MAFEPINTQEELDALIKERIKRAEAKAREDFADYDELKRLNEVLKTGSHSATTNKGDWSKIEIASTDRVIGYYVDGEGNESPTRYFKIHYGKRDAHIVPSKDEGALFD